MNYDITMFLTIVEIWILSKPISQIVLLSDVNNEAYYIDFKSIIALKPLVLLYFEHCISYYAMKVL